MPRGVFGRKKEELIGKPEKLHNEKLHNAYFSSYIIRITKSWRVGCVKHVAKYIHSFCQNPKGRDRMIGG
jgi:hypothetical protein